MDALTQKDTNIASLAKAQQDNKSECSTFYLNFFEYDISLRMSVPRVLQVSAVL